MSLRARLLFAFACVVFVPLALLAVGFRYEVTRRLSQQYERQLEVVRCAVEDDLRRESTTLQQQLTALAAAVADDNRFRAALAGVPEERQYLLDWAASGMRLTGMSLLQVIDEQGEILSSGHFRNEHGRIVPDLVPALQRRGGPVERTGCGGGEGALILIRVPDVDGQRLALARHAPIRIGDRALTLVGGSVFDEPFLKRLADTREVAVSLRYADRVLTSGASDPANGNAGAGDVTAAASARELRIMRIPVLLVSPEGAVAASDAGLVVVQPRTYLVSLQRSVDSWFLATAAGAGVLALLLALWLSSRVTRRLAALADKTAVIDLDRLDVEFDAGTDEVGRLSRVLGDLTARLRTGTARVREAERRATVGDLARQINHDIKNGLIPLRNVMRHLMQVGRDDPASLSGVLSERRPTIDSSIGYLETLATNYERLSATPRRRECDLHALILDVAQGVGPDSEIHVRTDLSASDARVFGDPVAIRRILENLVTNAADSLDNKPGRISIATATFATDEGQALRVTVADTGRGMSDEEAARIFEHFYSTKTAGGGLGLSIVRRLVTDLHGTVRVESELGKGTRMIVEIPMVRSRGDVPRAEAGDASRRHTGGRRR